MRDCDQRRVKPECHTDSGAVPSRRPVGMEGEQETELS